MPARRRPRRAPELGDPSLSICSYRLYRIDGVWCCETLAGTWEPAIWCGVVGINQLLDLLHHEYTKDPTE